MTKKEKFNDFINERITTSTTKASGSAYNVVKAQFNKLFKEEEEIYNAILDMDIVSESFTGTFVGEKKADAVFALIKIITDAVNVEHRANCKNKSDNCPGIITYMIPHLKIHLTAHPEYDIPTVLAIMSGIFLEIGRRDMEAKIVQNRGSGDIRGLMKLLRELDKRDNVEINVIEIKED